MAALMMEKPLRKVCDAPHEIETRSLEFEESACNCGWDGNELTWRHSYIMSTCRHWWCNYPHCQQFFTAGSVHCVFTLQINVCCWISVQTLASSNKQFFVMRQSRLDNKSGVCGGLCGRVHSSMTLNDRGSPLSAQWTAVEYGTRHDLL